MRLLIIVFTIFLIYGCATTDELTQTQRAVAHLNLELQNQKDELLRRISRLEETIKEQEENIIREKRERERNSQQILQLLTNTDNLNEKIKVLTGKLDELEHQINIYWKETKEEIINVKKALVSLPQVKEQKKEERAFEELYREAFESYQKANYEEAVRKFSDFIKEHSATPLAPNAYYWLGESFMALKDYEKAILAFQEVIEKHSVSEFAPKAYLSQAEAFISLGDRKSGSTTLKRVIQLYPRSEEAKIAERRLKNLLSE